jgi:hypothetical protein
MNVFRQGMAELIPTPVGSGATPLVAHNPCGLSR